jgi:hypothetical protein
MTTPFGESATGNELIDTLQNVQRMANTFGDLDHKIDYVRRASGLLAAGSLIERQFMVSASTIVGIPPDSAPDERFIYANGLMFVGVLESYNYLVIDNEPKIDSLTLNFFNPDVLGVETDDVLVMKQLRLQVPILDIDTFIAADAA